MSTTTTTTQVIISNRCTTLVAVLLCNPGRGCADLAVEHHEVIFPAMRAQSKSMISLLSHKCGGQGCTLYASVPTRVEQRNGVAYVVRAHVLSLVCI
jgi:hypothetical protein